MMDFTHLCINQILDLGEVAGGGGDVAGLHGGGGGEEQQDGAGVPLGPGRHTTEHPAQEWFMGTGVQECRSAGGQEDWSAGGHECIRTGQRDREKGGHEDRRTPGEQRCSSHVCLECQEPRPPPAPPSCSPALTYTHGLIELYDQGTNLQTDSMLGVAVKDSPAIGLAPWCTTPHLIILLAVLTNSKLVEGIPIKMTGSPHR